MFNQYHKTNTFGVTIFKSSRRNESRSFSCSADRITVVIVAAVAGTSDDGDQTLPDSIFSSVGTIRLLQLSNREKTYEFHNLPEAYVRTHTHTI